MAAVRRRRLVARSRTPAGPAELARRPRYATAGSGERSHPPRASGLAAKWRRSAP